MSAKDATVSAKVRDHEREGRDHERQGRNHDRQGGDHERQGRDHDRKKLDLERQGRDHDDQCGRLSKAVSNLCFWAILHLGSGRVHGFPRAPPGPRGPSISP